MEKTRPAGETSPEQSQTYEQFTEQERRHLSGFARSQGLIVCEEELDDLEMLNLCEDLMHFSMPNFIIDNGLEGILDKAYKIKRQILARLEESPLADPEILDEDTFGSYFGKCEKERKRYHASIRMKAVYGEMTALYKGERLRELNPDENEDHLSLWHCEKLLALKKYTDWLAGRNGDETVRRRFANGNKKQHAVNRLLTSLAENEMTLRRLRVIGNPTEEELHHIMLKVCRAVGNTADA